MTSQKLLNEKISMLKHDLSISVMQGRYISNEKKRLQKEIAELERLRNVAKIQKATQKSLDANNGG